jgi:hypothetical protein
MSTPTPTPTPTILTPQRPHPFPPSTPRTYAPKIPTGPPTYALASPCSKEERRVRQAFHFIHRSIPNLIISTGRKDLRLEAKLLRVKARWMSQRPEVRILMTIVHAFGILDEKRMMISDGKKEGVSIRVDESCMCTVGSRSGISVMGCCGYQCRPRNTRRGVCSQCTHMLAEHHFLVS